jgi:hypothetical protein
MEVTYENESPRKRLFHKITGWCVLTVGTFLTLGVYNFITTH